MTLRICIEMKRYRLRSWPEKLLSSEQLFPLNLIMELSRKYPPELKTLYRLYWLVRRVVSFCLMHHQG